VHFLENFFLRRTSCTRTFAIAGAFLVGFQKRPAIFAWSEIVALFFDVKLVAPQKIKNCAACCMSR
jgi:hypothetical protein